jgi:hypothetical protein
MRYSLAFDERVRVRDTNKRAGRAQKRPSGRRGLTL